MRILEWLTVAVLAAYAVAPSFRWRSWLPSAAVAATAAHLLLEGYRWQMVPLYVLVVLLAAIAVLRLLRPARASRPPTPRVRRTRRGWAALAGSLVVLLLMSAPPVLFPVPRLPDPGGPNRIGTVTFEWTDASRLEAYTPAPDDKRKIMVQLWYPAVPAAGATTAPWVDRLDVVGPHIADYLHLPSFFLDHASLVRTNDYADAPVDPAGGPYPVVIYSHGWNGFRAINLNQSEALASRGYIAVAVDHTYGAMVTAFADGQVALNNPAAIPTGVSPDAYQAATEQLEATFAADLRFTLDQLAQLNSGAIPSPLTGKLDLTRVGVYGHSTGGGATVVMCAADPRCKAALGMDPWVGPVPRPVLEAGLRQPFLAMMSQSWSSPDNSALLDTLLAAGTGDQAKMAIAGTSHYDFTMLPLLTPLAPALGLKGPIDGQRGMQIITDYLVAFFDHSLKGTGTVDRPGYPEVRYEVR
jgi:predicted dienelactone hydrolase